MTRTVLVTGAGGFIGAALSQRLIQRGDRVVGIDNLNDYYDPALKRARLRQIEVPTQLIKKSPTTARDLEILPLRP